MQNWGWERKERVGGVEEEQGEGGRGQSWHLRTVLEVVMNHSCPRSWVTCLIRVPVLMSRVQEVPTTTCLVMPSLLVGKGVA